MKLHSHTSTNNQSRRKFMRLGAAGMSALGAGGVSPGASAAPAETSSNLEAYANLFKNTFGVEPPSRWDPTEAASEGRHYRKGAPFRAKITPPGELGEILVIAGRVWAADSRRPLAHSVLEIWHADAQGRYDLDDSAKPLAKNVFLNRARLITDETGYYEFETIHPGPVKLSPVTWRASHIAYQVKHPGYRSLTTQLFFRGDPHHDVDPLLQPSLVIDLKEQKVAAAVFKTGRFDLVLERE